jgi:DNA-nicking Smr family endonuclease
MSSAKKNDTGKLPGVSSEGREEAARSNEKRRSVREELSADDRNLFKTSVRGVVPVLSDNRVAPEKPKPLPVPLKRKEDEDIARMEFMSGVSDADFMETDPDATYLRSGIGRDVLRKLKRGKWVIQDELDLHGLRREDAKVCLGLFLNHAVQSDSRCVRVVHGKGLGSVNQEPVLKKLVPQWLRQKDEVIAFTQAAPTDGGSGALVVLLRAKRR